jgi:beta-glucuronidase
MRILRLLAPLLLFVLAAAPAASAQDGISKRVLYADGPDNRHLLGGKWLFRLDKEEVGLARRFQRQSSTAGWSPVTVPNAWNATDESVESMSGTVGWYRKDFRLPNRSSRRSWIVRFESVNYRSRVWLNGKPIGTNRGAYLPFELRLPASVLRRGGVNRLVVRVDNRRKGGDFPPSGLARSGVPTGGWWNYGGLLREVYLREVDEIDFSTVQVRPELACAKCSARVFLRTTVRNYAREARRVRVTGRFGGRSIAMGTKSVGAGKFATYTRRITVRNPRLWEPGKPRLYNASFTARAGDRKRIGWSLKSGIRSVKVVDGRLTLNGKAMDFRGVGMHEDDPDRGFAIDNAKRKLYVDQAKEVGATLLRSHYPLHPYIHELADREGLMIWSEIPVYAIKTEFLKQRLVRDLARNELRENINTHGNHPSVIMWSIGNELSARPGPVQESYIKNAVRQAKQLDPTRPVGLAVAGYPAAGCRKQYDALDVIGINDYFGWYPGPNGQIADREVLPEYLDAVRACYPKKAIVMSEFGAEANRSGPVEEKGTFEHQQDFVNYHLGVYATKPWLSGAIYWGLQEFRVRPGWDGGNPRPNSPIHEKGLLTFRGNAKKPAWTDMQRLFTQTRQLKPRG